MQIRIEKMNCPNCDSAQMEIDYDNYVAHCPFCDGRFPVQIGNGEAIFTERELRKTMEAHYEEQRKTAASEYEEQRKTLEFLNEEDRRQSEFERTKGFRNAKDKLKWARIGAIFGLIAGVVFYILARNIVVPILAFIAITVLFIPGLFDDNKKLNTGIKLICALLAASLGVYSGYAVNARRAEQAKARQELADEARAPHIPLGVSHADVSGIDYHEAVRIFRANGFTNVETAPVNDLEISSREAQDTVISVTVKGNTSFAETDVYANNVRITIAYHNLGDKEAQIEVGTSSEEMLEMNYDVVQGLFKNAGFINIELKPIYDISIGVLKKEGETESVSVAGQSSFVASSSFRFDAPVQIAYHAKKSDEKNDHTGEISIPSSSKKYLGRNYAEVEKELRNAGFANIEIVRKTARTGKENGDEIVLISVNGKTDFDKGEWFVSESSIVITYYGPKTAEELKEEHPEDVNVPYSAKAFRKMSYEDAVDALTAAGFVDIKAEPVNDLRFGILNKAGSIKSISIGGQTDFDSDAWFPPEAEIKIVYHDLMKTDEDGDGSRTESPVAEKDPATGS